MGATSEHHMQNTMQLPQELAGASKMFLFKTMPSLASLERAPAPTPHMLTEPWERADHDTFFINQP